MNPKSPNTANPTGFKQWPRSPPLKPNTTQTPLTTKTTNTPNHHPTRLHAHFALPPSPPSNSQNPTPPRTFAARLIQTLYHAEPSKAQFARGQVAQLRSFLLVKTKPGMEKEVQSRFNPLPEVREVHLITGKFDLLVALESQETELDPRRKVAELVIEKVRTAGGVVDTRTIIPIETELRPTRPPERPTTKGFVFVMSEAGKTKELMAKLLEIPEVRGVYMLFGKADVLTELEVEKSLINPPPQHIADIVETRIAKLPAVHDTDTYVPLESMIK